MSQKFMVFNSKIKRAWWVNTTLCIILKYIEDVFFVAIINIFHFMLKNRQGSGKGPKFKSIQRSCSLKKLFYSPTIKVLGNKLGLSLGFPNSHNIQAKYFFL